MTEHKEKARPAAVAGTFYPGTGPALSGTVRGFLSDCARKEPEGTLRGLVVPHAGYAYSGIVAAAGYRLLAGMKRKPGRVILLGPSHYAYFEGIAAPNPGNWETPLGKIRAGDIRKLCGESPMVIVSDEAHAPEHSLEVQLPFLQETLSGFEAYPMLANEVDAKKAAEYISKALDSDDAILVVSSDLSHYQEYSRAKETDGRTIFAIESGKADGKRKIDACGRMGIEIAMEICRIKGWRITLLDARNSGDTAGDKSRVVGYASFALTSGKA